MLTITVDITLQINGKKIFDRSVHRIISFMCSVLLLFLFFLHCASIRSHVNPRSPIYLHVHTTLTVLPGVTHSSSSLSASHRTSISTSSFHLHRISFRPTIHIGLIVRYLNVFPLLLTPEHTNCPLTIAMISLSA